LGASAKLKAEHPSSTSDAHPYPPNQILKNPTRAQENLPQKRINLFHEEMVANIAGTSALF